MWDEYAASIGTTANNLTQQQKIQAEVNGIMEETKFQVGDAAAYANTFAGKVAKVSTAFYNFKVAVGKFVAPIAELFLPYIEMALNALTRFFNKMSQVLAVFGLKMPDVISKTSSTIANVGQSASNTADSIGKTGDAATEAAKKMNKAFGKMDEINVLNFNKSAKSGGSSGSSGGSSGGAGLGDGAITDTTEIVDKEPEISPAIQKIADKLKELVAPLKEISFDNLINAFDRLKEAVKPLTEKLFTGLEWLWFNILVPFAKWTIEDFIPAFFIALAGALDFVNGAIDYAKPYLQWLWEEFLQPIAKWTGGVIVETLELIGDKLSIVGKWLSANAPEIENVRKQLKPFSDALEQIAIFAGKLIGLAWEGLTRALKDLWDNVLKPLWDYLLYPLLTTLWSKFQSIAIVIGGIVGALNKILEGDWKGSIKEIKDMFTDLNEIKFDLMDRLNKHFKEKAEEIKLEFIKKTQEFEKWWDELPEKLGNWLGKALGKIAKFFIVDIPAAIDKFFTETLPKKWGELKTWFSELPGKIKEELTKEKAKESLKESGKSLIDGLWQGIMSWLEDIKTKWEQFKTSFVEGFKEAFKINSPSKVFEEYGKDIIDGLINGLLSLKNKTIEAWNKVKGWFTDIVKTAKVEIKQKWTDIKRKWEDITKNIKDKTASMKARIGTTWSSLKRSWESITKNIKDKTASMKARIGTTWSSLRSTWNNLMANFKDKTVTITAKLATAAGSAKGFANEVIAKLNSKLPSWLPKIPKLAQGGYLQANNPQLAIVGDNKREGEIISPESKIYEQAKKAIEESGASNKQVLDLTIKLEYPDGKHLIKQINDVQIKDGKISLLV